MALFTDYELHLSKAQQSCVPATALGAIDFLQIVTPKIYQKSTKQSMKNQTQIDQNQRWSEKCRALRLGSRLEGVLEAS